MASLKSMYEFYKEKYPESDVTYAMYSYIIEKFNKRVVEEILNGHTFYPGHRLGSIRIKKIERNYSNPVINWGETNKLKAQGINKHVYYTDSTYYRWYWEKRKSQVKNKSVYRFQATKGQNGARKQLVRKLKNEKFAYLNFKP